MKTIPENLFICSEKIHLNNGVYGRFIKKVGGRFEFVVVIDDNTSAEKLRSAWGVIDSKREYLKQDQGTDLKGADILLANYENMKRSGASYADIAKTINYSCLFHLCRAVVQKNKGIKPSSLYQASYHLKAMRMKNKDIREWLLPALDTIREGRLPWSPENGPIDWMRVRDSLRQWDIEQKNQKVVIKESILTRNISIDQMVENDSEWLDAYELLKKLENSG